MQEEGLLGRLVGTMIRSSVRKHFHTVYWSQPRETPPEPCIFYCNHHGWMDGYLMFHLITRLGIRGRLWIEEFNAFPLFRYVGGLPFAPGSQAERLATIRQTIRELKSGTRSLVLFPEGVLHRPPELLPFQRGLELLATKCQDVKLVPVAIRYELSMHSRPEAWIRVGEPHAFESLIDTQNRLQCMLNSEKKDFEVLVHGTKDVNEKMDMRRAPGFGKIR